MSDYCPCKTAKSPCACLVPVDTKRVSDTLELELQEVVVYDVGIKPQFGFSRETTALKH